MTMEKRFQTDVLVAGGGVAGVSAALTAARRGLRTLLIESQISLGGLATHGSVNRVAGMVESYRERIFKGGGGKVAFFILEDKCIGCGLCARRCPADAISGEKRQLHVIDQDRCIKCGECYSVCKFDAVSRNHPSLVAERVAEAPAV